MTRTDISNTGFPDTKSRLMPLILSAAIIVVDQLTKALIVGLVEYRTIAASYLDGFFRIVHTRNLAIAFSIGRNLPDPVRRIAFTVLPLVIMAVVLVYFIRTDELTRLQRWSVAAILGGGIGNLIDRVFRPLGVVDFLDVKFYGLFGLERWPTFNVADSCVVVGGILLMLGILFEKKPVEMGPESEGGFQAEQSDENRVTKE
jgi:signal peptidase II